MISVYEQNTMKHPDQKDAESPRSCIHQFGVSKFEAAVSFDCLVLFGEVVRIPASEVLRHSEGLL